MKDNIIQKKSYAFAVLIVQACQRIRRGQHEYVLTKQLLRSGTSIAANIEEAIGGQSRSDFLTKITIAYKEAREACFWPRLLRDTGYVGQSEFAVLHADAEELCRIIGSIQLTIKSRR